LLGDKVFGLLVAHITGLPVPRSTVINRRVAPFTFGRLTGSTEVWMRTSPHEQVPGKFTTTRGWSDPFKILAKEDPDGKMLASIIAQDSVKSEYSGAVIVTIGGDVLIEGKSGEGESFMRG